MAPKRKASHGHSHGRGRRRGRRADARTHPRQQQQQQQQVAPAAPSADFLAALEAQRAAEARRQEQQQQQQPQVADAALAATSPPVRIAELPGFDYDPATGKYFRRPRGGAAHVVNGARRAASNQAEVDEKHAAKTRSTRRDWRRNQCAALLARREVIGGQWNRHRQLEHHMMVRLCREKLYEGETPVRLRRVDSMSLPTEMLLCSSDFHANGDIAVVGSTCGSIVVLPIDSEDSNFRRHKRHMRDTCSWVTAVQWKPDELSGPKLRLLTASIGESDDSSGIVAVREFDRDRWGLRPEIKMQLDLQDTWTAQWSCDKADQLILGMDKSIGAARIDLQRPDLVIRAPFGQIRSEVVAQTLLAPEIVLNGVRNGSLWLWDFRVKRRIHEHQVRNQSSPTCMSPLKSGHQVVIHMSDTAMSLVDIRMPYKTVIQYTEGKPRRYSPARRHDLIHDESVIAAPAVVGDGVSFYDVRTGAYIGDIKQEEAIPKGDRIIQVHCTPDTMLPLWGVGSHSIQCV